jgi:hypothetical protein
LDVEAFRERTRQKLKEMQEQGLIHPTESNPAGLPPPTPYQERMGTPLTPVFISKASPEELMQESQRMREAGESGQARRFADVASQMQRGPVWMLLVCSVMMKRTKKRLLDFCTVKERQERIIKI